MVCTDLHEHFERTQRPTIRRYLSIRGMGPECARADLPGGKTGRQCGAPQDTRLGRQKEAPWSLRRSKTAAPNQSVQRTRKRHNPCSTLRDDSRSRLQPLKKLV